MRDLARGGIAATQLSGSPYPEMGRAEMARVFLESNCDVWVMMDPCVATDLANVEALSEHAARIKGVAVPEHGAELGAHARGWNPSLRNHLSLCAIHRTVLEELAAYDDRVYDNSCVLDTGFSKGSRPFFSPWKKNGELLAPGFYVPDDVAFLMRVKERGFPIEYKSIDWTHLGLPRYSERVTTRKPSMCRFAVGVPCFGPQDREQAMQLWALEKYGVPIIEIHNCPYIDVARSRIKQIAIDEAGLDGVFYLDHDIVFKPDDLLDLIDEAEKRQALVAGAYCMRMSARAVIGAIEAAPGDHILWFEGGEVRDALYTGLGFAAVPRSIFEALDFGLPELQSAYPKLLRPYFSLDISGSFYCGEDVSFCNRIQALEVKRSGPEDWNVVRKESSAGRVLIDTRVRIFHRGLYDYGLEDAGLVVPRLSTLDQITCATRDDARKLLKTTLDLPADVMAESLDKHQEGMWDA